MCPAGAGFGREPVEVVVAGVLVDILHAGGCWSPLMASGCTSANSEPAAPPPLYWRVRRANTEQPGEPWSPGRTLGLGLALAG
jgi:hypothetical protein